jgi:hypothetical protein
MNDRHLVSASYLAAILSLLKPSKLPKHQRVNELINGHPTRHLRQFPARTLAQLGRHWVPPLLRCVLQLSPRDIRHQPLVEVVRAHASVHNRHDNQNDGDNGERCQFFPRAQVETAVAGGVHADHLKDEVGQAAEIEELHSCLSACKSI